MTQAIPVPPPEVPAHLVTKTCWGCSAAIGQLHDEACDWARCEKTGLQRQHCRYDIPDHDGDCGADIWKGIPSNSADAIRLDLWYRWDKPARQGGRAVPCAPGDEGAIPDSSPMRMFGVARWDAKRKEWVRR